MEQRIELLPELMSRLINIMGKDLFMVMMCVIGFVVIIHMTVFMLKVVAQIIEAEASREDAIARQKEADVRLEDIRLRKTVDTPSLLYRSSNVFLPPHRFTTLPASLYFRLRNRNHRALVVVIMIMTAISAIFLVLVCVYHFSSPFRDVSFRDEYFRAVKWAYRKNITTGMEDGIFAPYGVCTREHAMIFIHRAVGLPESEIASDTRDCTRGEFITYLWIVVEPSASVPNNQKLGRAVEWAINSGITKATSLEEFSADTPCQRWHAAVFLYNARNLM